MPRLSILYFAAAAEAAGGFREDMQLSAAMTVLDLRAELRRRHPALARVPFRIAVNQTFAGDTCGLQEGDEIAVLPPVAGG